MTEPAPSSPAATQSAQLTEISASFDRQFRQALRDTFPLRDAPFDTCLHFSTLAFWEIISVTGDAHEAIKQTLGWLQNAVARVKRPKDGFFDHVEYRLREWLRQTDLTTGERKASFQRFAVWRDPLFAGELPPDRVLNGSPEVILNYQRAAVERLYREQFQNWERHYTEHPPMRIEGEGNHRLEFRQDHVIAFDLRTLIVTYICDSLAAIADFVLDSDLRGEEALKAFDEHAEKFCRENSSPRWRFGVERLRLADKFDAEFMETEKAAVSEIRSTFEETVWGRELESGDAVAPEPAVIATEVNSERRKMVQAYKAEGQAAGVKITNPMIGAAVDPESADPGTIVIKWQKYDTRYEGQTPRFIKVFREKPHIPSR